MILLKEIISNLPFSLWKLVRPFLMALAAFSLILLLIWGRPENSMYLRVVNLERRAVIQQQPDLRLLTSTMGIRMVLMLFWEQTNSFWQKVPKSGFISMYFRKSYRSRRRKSRFQSISGMLIFGSSQFRWEFLYLSLMILVTLSSVLETPFLVCSKAFKEMSWEERVGSASIASLIQDQRVMHISRQSLSWLISSLQSNLNSDFFSPSFTGVVVTCMNLLQLGMLADSFLNCSSLLGSLGTRSTLFWLVFLRSQVKASSIFRTSNLLWYSFLSEFLMAVFNRTFTSSSLLSLSPRNLKNSWKLTTFLGIWKTAFWKSVSSLLVSLQRLASYSERKWALLARFSQISVMNSLQKQKMWKLVIWDLKTISVLFLSACSSSDSLISSGTAFRIQKTCRSSCSRKYCSATSLNLKESVADKMARMQPRLGVLFLCLASSSLKNRFKVSTTLSASSGNRLRQQRNMEWMWVRMRMIRMEGCFFSSMMWKTRVMNSLGKTSRTYSGLKFLVEFVIIMDSDFFRKWKKRSSLSPSPKYTGSQCEIFQLVDVRFIDSLMKALIEMQSKQVSPSFISPVRGILEMLRPRPSWFCRQPSLVWKQISSLRMRSFSSYRIWNSDITCSLGLKVGQQLSLPPCLQTLHLKELASFTAFLISMSVLALSPVRISSKRKLWSWVRTLWTLQAELQPPPSSARTPSYCWIMSRQMKSPKTLGWGILLKMRMEGGWLGQLWGNLSSRWKTPPSQGVFSGPLMLACQMKRSVSRGRAVTPTVGMRSFSISSRSLMSRLWEKVCSFSLTELRMRAVSMCLPAFFIPKYLIPLTSWIRLKPPFIKELTLSLSCGCCLYGSQSIMVKI